MPSTSRAVLVEQLHVVSAPSFPGEAGRGCNSGTAGSTGPGSCTRWMGSSLPPTLLVGRATPPLDLYHARRFSRRWFACGGLTPCTPAAPWRSTATPTPRVWSPTPRVWSPTPRVWPPTPRPVATMLASVPLTHTRGAHGTVRRSPRCGVEGAWIVLCALMLQCCMPAHPFVLPLQRTSTVATELNGAVVLQWRGPVDSTSSS